MRDKLIKFLEKNLNDFDVDFEKLIEIPKKSSLGDFSMPCFVFSKTLSKNPSEIAIDFHLKLNKNLDSFLEKIEVLGPFLNFYLNWKKISLDIFLSINDNSFFNFDLEPKKNFLIEYPSPNTNKSLHIGHVRNMLIGNSLTKIFRKIGHKVIKTNMNNDRGIAICKSMLGYELFFKNQTPKDLNLKSDEFVSKCYVEFEKHAKLDSNLNKKAQELLVLWENEDEYAIKLWEKIMHLVFTGYKQTYKNFKITNFDKEYFESQIYKKGKEIVENALENKVKGFKKDETGAIFCDLEDVNLDKKYLLREDKTSLYITQDLYLAKLKEKEFNPDKSIFIVGKDQEYHFKVLFELLDRLGFNANSKNFHFAYGYVYNKDGKKFSSRKGEVVGANWMLELVVNESKKNLENKEKTYNLDEKELERRAQIIGYSALCFNMLKSNPYDDIKFDIQKALQVKGESGPYILYTFARINSILEKLNFQILKIDFKKLDFNLLEKKHINLIKILKDYNKIVLEASKKYKISLIANYLLKLSQNFNDFYQNSDIKSEDKNLQEILLVLCYLIKKIIKDGLDLLDIEVLEQM